MEVCFPPGCSACHQGLLPAVGHAVWVLWKLSCSPLVQARGVAVSAAERMWRVFVTARCNSHPHPVPISKHGKQASLPKRACQKLTTQINILKILVSQEFYHRG